MLILQIQGNVLILNLLHDFLPSVLTVFNAKINEILIDAGPIPRLARCQSGRNPNVHPLSKPFYVSPLGAHDTSCGSCGIKSDILSFSLWWKRKHPTILNCIIVSYKINYFICLNTVTLLFSSDLLLPSVCITVIFSTPTLCMLKCQNPASIIPVISLLFLMG